MNYLVIFADQNASTNPDTIESDVADELEASSPSEAAEVFVKEDCLACSGPEEHDQYVLVSESRSSVWQLFRVSISLVAKAVPA